MRIILLRHGRTEWNEQKRFSGRADIPLDETGIEQVKAVAERLASSDAAAIYSSPLRRALMTARPIADRIGLAIQPLDQLTDIDCGTWQGLSTDQARAQDGDLYRRWLESPHQIRFPHGESFPEVRERVTGVAKRLLDEHSDQTVIMVSHVVVCRILVCIVLGLDDSHFWQIGQDVCAVNTITAREGRFMLNSLNDTGHLKGLG
ncbi:MAG: histidine phosphatase family protein [Dehalococcoidia bacterium]|nr:histidine phosphatase family protein [Dehalococcoidia bacterium]